MALPFTRRVSPIRPVERCNSPPNLAMFPCRSSLTSSKMKIFSPSRSGSSDPRTISGPVQASLHLLGLVRVRVVPEHPSVGEREAILESHPRLDRVLRHLGAVHVCRDSQAVPVNVVADLAFDRRPRHQSVEPVPGYHLTRRDLPLGRSEWKLRGRRSGGPHQRRARSLLNPSPTAGLPAPPRPGRVTAIQAVGRTPLRVASPPTN